MTARLLVRGGWVITMDPTLGVLRDTDVLVEDGVIAAIGRLGDVDAEVLDASRHVVLPGFVDSHRHTWQAFLRGIAADWTLGQYFTGLHFGLSGLFTPEDTYAGNFIGAVEALDSGITTLLDWSHNVNTAGHADAAVAALRDAGLRAVFAHGGGADMYQVPSVVPHDQDVRRVQKEQFDSADALVTLAMALRGPQYATLDITEDDIHLARELGLRVTLHAGDGEWGRSRPIEQLLDRDLLGPDITFVHCNTLADDELQMIADSGGHASVSPDIEMQMGHGWPATGRLTAVGVRPGLSIDTCVSNGGNMFGTMRVCLATQRAIDNEVPGASDRPAVSLTSEDVLSFATLDGAHTVGLGGTVGSLSVGKRADLVALRGDSLELAPINHPIGQVVYAAHPGLVDAVVVDGRVVKRDGHLLHGLAERAVQLATEHRDNLFARAVQQPGLAEARADGSWQPAPLAAS
ncbi:MAG: 5-methylthioadenosine/S-adenosylhomocysteine deaminase [Actinomycetota bacterium]|nr:5-methylthioadenosine/S-adenosylhomocysteine deaminase [Actinomycetota bacterium]